WTPLIAVIVFWFGLGGMEDKHRLTATGSALAAACKREQAGLAAAGPAGGDPGPAALRRGGFGGAAGGPGGGAGRRAAGHAGTGGAGRAVGRHAAEEQSAPGRGLVVVLRHLAAGRGRARRGDGHGGRRGHARGGRLAGGDRLCAAPRPRGRPGAADPA